MSSTGGLQGQKGPHLYLSLLWGVVGDLGGEGGSKVGGTRNLSPQRGVNFSVTVSLVQFLFLFFFVKSWGGAGRCCGLVWWRGFGGRR